MATSCNEVGRLMIPGFTRVRFSRGIGLRLFHVPGKLAIRPLKPSRPWARLDTTAGTPASGTAPLHETEAGLPCRRPALRQSFSPWVLVSRCAPCPFNLPAIQYLDCHPSKVQDHACLWYHDASLRRVMNASSLASTPSVGTMQIKGVQLNSGRGRFAARRGYSPIPQERAP